MNLGAEQPWKTITIADVEAATKRLETELGSTNFGRIQSIVKVSNPNTARVGLDKALDVSFPQWRADREMYLTNFRMLRKSLRDACVLYNSRLVADGTTVMLRLEVDKQTRQSPEYRECWFEMPNNLHEVIDRRISAQTSLLERFPQSARQLEDGKKVVRYFLSYASDNFKLKTKLVDRLHNYFFESNPDFKFKRWEMENIEPGERWHAEIQRAIRACDFGLLLTSPAFFASKYIKTFELIHFVATSENDQGTAKCAIPVMLEPYPFDGSIDLCGLSDYQVFRCKGRAFSELRDSSKQLEFSQELFQRTLRVLKSRLDVQTVEQSETFEPVSWPIESRYEIEVSAREELLPKMPNLRLTMEEPVRDDAEPDQLPPIKLARTETDVVEMLESWLENDHSTPYGLLLGETGMGKTTSTLHLAKIRSQAHRDGKAAPVVWLDCRRLSAAWVRSHTDLDLDDLLKQLLTSSLLGGATTSHDAISPDQVKRLITEQRGLIIVDGLDEVLVHIGEKQGAQFLDQVLSLLPARVWRTLQGDRTSRADRPYGHLLMTCRDHYFRNGLEQTGMFTALGRNSLREHDFFVLTLLPLTDNQIRNYFRGIVGSDAELESLMTIIASIHNLTELAQRPYTLSLIRNMVPELEHAKARGRTINGAVLYDLMVQKWLIRDKTKHQLKIDHKVLIMQQLAAQLWKAKRKSWRVSDLENWFTEILVTHPDLKRYYSVEKDRLPALEEDLRTATFIARVGDDEFQFAHTSLQEFFLAGYLLRALIESGASSPTREPSATVTSEQAAQMELAATAVKEAWQIADLNRETLTFFGQLLHAQPKENRDDALRGFSHLFSKSDSIVTRNALAYTLLAMDRKLPVPSLAGADLSGQDCSNLSANGLAENVHFRGTPDKWLNMRGVKFDRCFMNQARFSYADLQQATFVGASAVGTVWNHCRLDAAQRAQGNWDAAFIRDAEAIVGNENSVRPKMADDATSNHQLASPYYACRFPTNSYRRPMRIEATTFAIGPNDLAALAGYEAIGDYGSIHLWDMRSGRCLRDLPITSRLVTSLVFNANGLLASAHSPSAQGEGGIRLWEPYSGRCLGSVETPMRKTSSLAFGENGELASGDSDGIIRIWSPDLSDCLRELKASDHALQCLAFGPGGVLASGGRDGTIRIWNSESGQCLREFQVDSVSVGHLAFDSGGLLASAGDNGSIVVWNIETGSGVGARVRHRLPVSLAFAPNRVLVSAGFGGNILVWDPRSDSIPGVRSGLSVLSARLGIAFDSAGVFASVSRDGIVRRWNPQFDQCQRELADSVNLVNRLAIDSSGMMATAGDDRVIRIWDSGSGRCLRELTGHTGSVRALAFDSTDVLASAGNDRVIRLWNPHSGRCQFEMAGHLSAIVSLAFGSDGVLASAGGDGTIRIWDTRLGQMLREIPGALNSVACLAFSSNGILASAGHESTIRLWNTRSGQCEGELIGHHRSVFNLAFGSDDVLASGGHDGFVRLWDTRSGQNPRDLRRPRVLYKHEGTVHSLAFDSNGILASAGDDRIVRLWDTRADRSFGELAEQSHAVLGLAFDSRGSLACVTRDSKISTYDSEHFVLKRTATIVPDGGLVYDDQTQSVVQAWGDAWLHMGRFDDAPESPGQLKFRRLESGQKIPFIEPETTCA